MARIDFLSQVEPEGGGRRRRRLPLMLGALVVVGIVLSVLFSSFFTYIHPHEVGVKQSRYGGGIDAAPYPGPGLYFTAPGVTFHRFPTVVQTLTMNSSPAEAMAAGEHTRAVPSLEVDSRDGSKIRIDATLLYRISDSYAVMTRIGPGRLFEDSAIIPRASQALKKALGALAAEDFYNEVLRIKATEVARDQLNAELKELGLQIDYVLIRQYAYLSDYQSQIEERKVQDQLVFTNQSMAESARTEANRVKIDAEGAAAVEVEKQRGSAEVAKIRAEADLYKRKKYAEGDLLVQLAQAKGTQMENAAYKASAGSDNLVGLEMAEVLEGIDVIFVNSGEGGTNVLDLNDTLRMFDVGGR